MFHYSTDRARGFFIKKLSILRLFPIITASIILSLFAVTELITRLASSALPSGTIMKATNKRASFQFLHWNRYKNAIRIEKYRSNSILQVRTEVTVGDACEVPG